MKTKFTREPAHFLQARILEVLLAHPLLLATQGPTRHVMSGCRWSLPAAWGVIEGSRAVSEVSWWPLYKASREAGVLIHGICWGLVVRVAESWDSA